MRCKKIKVLGRGSYGLVYLVKEIGASNKNYALKTCINNNINKTAFENEINLLKILKHNNIISIINFEKTKKSLNILMEYAEKGTLEDKIKKYKKIYLKFNQDEIKQIITSMTQGIEYLHFNKIIHRDIKPSNILITHDNKIKIADFGVSRFLNDTKMIVTTIGSPHYMAPEIYDGSGYSYPVDYWALGCILYELLTMKKPFNADNIYALCMAVHKGYYVMSIIKYKYRDILKGLINLNKKKRLGYRQVINFFNDYNLNCNYNLPKLNNTYKVNNSKKKSMHELVSFYKSR